MNKNMFVAGTWYGPSYPDAGAPPEGSVDQRAYGGDDTPPVDDMVSVAEPSAPMIAPDPEYVVDPPETSAASDDPPPQAGPGSSRAKWLDYADAHGVRMRDDASREDIIAACETAGVRTE